jgi:hypothetical protein
MQAFVERFGGDSSKRFEPMPIHEHLVELDKTAGPAGNYLFYLAVADRFFRRLRH